MEAETGTTPAVLTKTTNRIRIFTLGPHGSFGMLSWTTNRAEAAACWGVFWGAHLSSHGDGRSADTVDYMARYREIHPNDPVGLEHSDETRERIHAALSPISIFGKRPRINIQDLYTPGGLTEAVRGINTRRFTGFEHDGVAFKDVSEEALSEYCPSLPKMRNF